LRSGSLMGTGVSWANELMDDSATHAHSMAVRRFFILYFF
jgi:hypothetical protein